MAALVEGEEAVAVVEAFQKNVVVRRAATTRVREGVDELEDLLDVDLVEGEEWQEWLEPLATRLEKGLRTLLPSQRFLPVMARNLVAFSALGATISLGAPLLFQRLGI